MKKRIFSIVPTLCIVFTLFMVFILMPTTAYANTYGTYGDFSYEVSGDEVTITYYSGSDINVTIPGAIEDKPVTAIDSGAFMDKKSLTSVTIPNSVTSVGDRAFDGCSNLTSINIPSSVTSIGQYPFIGCQGLTSITVDNGNTFYSSVDGVLFDKSKTQLLQYPVGNPRDSYTIPDGVTSIKELAFALCEKLTSVTIPNSVESIEMSAFWKCTGLTGVTIPNSVTSIGNQAFSECTKLSNVAFNTPSNITSIGSYAFSGCTGLTGIAIPDSVTSIGQEAFYGCTGLTSVTISDSVTSIGFEVFHGCTGLISVTIPDSVTSIGNYAFYGCTGLTGVTIPDSVTSIGPYAFNYCTSLESIFLPDKDDLSIGANVIPDATSQVRYRLDEVNGKVQVTITGIDLGTGKTSVAIPDTICGYQVVAVVAAEQPKVGVHTCKGGTATCNALALCTLCGEEYGDSGHSYEWQSENGKYWKKCQYCGDETSKKDIPTITINGADTVCVNEDYKFSFTLPEGTTDAFYGYDFKTKGVMGITPVIENNQQICIVSESWYDSTKNSFEVYAGAVTMDGFEFFVTKTVALNSEHVDVEPKDNICDICGAKIPSKDETATETGDNSHMVLWISLLFVSGGLLAATGIYSKKKKCSAR